MADLIVYLDASALVKRYVAETGTQEVVNLLQRASVVGTANITKVEVSAALAKSVRAGVLSPENAQLALRNFYEDWRFLERLHVVDLVVSRASTLAWEEGLRGYDATHLACALVWQEMLDEPVVMATFDRQLWEAARRMGMKVWPEGLTV